MWHATLLIAALIAVPPSAGGNVQPLWIEGEAWHSQVGSVGPDRPRYASRGACLGSQWAGDRNDWAAYRFYLESELEQAVACFRYARLDEGDSHFDLILDGKLAAGNAAFASTGGWGHRRNDEWQYRTIRIGSLGKGWHELKLVSLADRNNTNLDGFFLAGEPFQPPNLRGEIEKCPQPPLRSGADGPGPDWVDNEFGLDGFTARLDDWYYPSEEPAERAAVTLPSVLEFRPDGAQLASADRTTTARVTVGTDFDGWNLAARLDRPEPIVVLHRDFHRWGLIVYLAKDHTVAEIREAVGQLPGLEGPRVRFPKDYFTSLLAAKRDVLGEKVPARSHEPDYETVAGYLAPLETYTFLGSPQSPVKYFIQPDGAICRQPEHGGPPVISRDTRFDLATLLPAGLAPVHPRRVKQGLLGGYLPAINYGYFDAESGIGWELSALMDPGESPIVLLRFRRTDGPPRYFRLEPLQELSDGRDFYAALLRLKESWDVFFQDGFDLEIPDRRVRDACRAAIARAASGCVGLHPKYGVGHYWGKQHDGFPPTTLSLNACLLHWGLHQQAKDRLSYYFDNFIQADGTFHYYGPAISEYGQLLHLATDCVRLTGDEAWFDRHRPAIHRVVDQLLRLRAESRKQPTDALTYGLLYGSPEADTREQTEYYFSNSAWCWRGMREIGSLEAEIGRKRQQPELLRDGQALLAECDAMRSDILRSVERSLVPAEAVPFLPPIAGFGKPFATMTQDTLASYTNYRYWLETLSSQCLPPDQEWLMIQYRLAHGGELLGMTRFSGHLDDWPYYHYARSLLAHDRVAHFLLGYFGHLAHHQMPGTFMAYEQVAIQGYGRRRQIADYCVPSQLTIPLMTRWMLVVEEPNDDALWLCRAAPRAWFGSGLSVRAAPTRWGLVGFQCSPSEGGLRLTARVKFSGGSYPIVRLRIRHPQALRIARCDAAEGLQPRIDAEREMIEFRPNRAETTLQIAFLKSH
ncbi:MAG: hypothetical protein HUU20_22545 [Pirellulales bacterium]|nr:hypothetical protein [Pirellulales bacterium]